MSSDTDAIKPGGDDSLPAREDDAVDGQLKRLEKDFRELTERAQNLLTERVYLENEVSQQKKKVNRGDSNASFSTSYRWACSR